MPYTKSRGDHVKVYRPSGTKYGQGSAADCTHAIMIAFGAFVMEFGYLPKQQDTVIEVIGVTGKYVCDVFEVKEPDGKT